MFNKLEPRSGPTKYHRSGLITYAGILLNRKMEKFNLKREDERFNLDRFGVKNYHDLISRCLLWAIYFKHV